MNADNLKFINYCVSLLTLVNNYAKYIDDVKLTSTKLTFTTSYQDSGILENPYINADYQHKEEVVGLETFFTVSIYKEKQNVR